MTTPTYFGYNFPFVQGDVVLQQQSDERLVKNDLIQLLLTEPGERIQRPGFGTNFRSFVFELSDNLSLERLKTSIQTAIDRYEPRITVKNIEIQSDDENTLSVKLYAALSIRPNNDFLIQLNIDTNTGNPAVVRPNE